MEATDKASRKVPGWVGCVVVLVMLPALSLLLNRAGGGRVDAPSQTAVPQAVSTPRAIDAYIAAQGFVKQRLKAPRGAKFPHEWEAKIIDLGDGEWQVVSHVDAENSFGAVLRAGFVCVVKSDVSPEGLKWTCVTCDVTQPD